MELSKFETFWTIHSNDWYEHSKIEKSGECVSVKELCTIKKNCVPVLYENYISIKRIIKDSYFRNPESKLLSRYKRAAVLSYTILLSNPLEYKDESRKQIDPDFLKQRLAFSIGLSSIVQDYPEQEVRRILDTSSETGLFRFKEIDANCHSGDDDFLMSVYKDMFFSEVYQNYNVLTMANVFGLLTELGSPLHDINTSEE